MEICQKQAKIFFDVSRDVSVGAIQALIDELEFNESVAEKTKNGDQLGCLFLDEQFRRAIHDGAIAVLEDELKSHINRAYNDIRRANTLISNSFRNGRDTTLYAAPMQAAVNSVSDAKQSINAALESLFAFLSSEPELSEASE